MSRRLIAGVLTALLALQAIIVAPATFASGISSHATTLSGDCPHHAGKDSNKCPCCPQGSAMFAGCMNLCTALATGFIETLLVLQSIPGAAISFPQTPTSTQTYAPLDPPPIH